jgi:uncharacterized protein YicC (UPF0701 family)
MLAQKSDVAEEPGRLNTHARSASRTETGGKRQADA